MKQWRSGSRNTLNARAITQKDMVKLVQTMDDDGLFALITPKAIKWYYGMYEVKKSSVQKVWGLSDWQMRSVHQYIYENDPFYEYLRGRGDDRVNTDID